MKFHALSPDTVEVIQTASNAYTIFAIGFLSLYGYSWLTWKLDKRKRRRERARRVAAARVEWEKHHGDDPAKRTRARQRV